VTASVTALLGAADVTVGNNPSDPLYTDSSSRGQIQQAMLFQNFAVGVRAQLFNTGGVPTSLWGWTIEVQPPGSTGQFDITLLDGWYTPVDAAIGYTYTVPTGVLAPVVVVVSLAVPLPLTGGGVVYALAQHITVTGSVSVRYSVP
jgi:hypothetical protein